MDDDASVGTGGRRLEGLDEEDENLFEDFAVEVADGKEDLD